MSNETFEMVAKTLFGLEDVLADELQGLGATDIEKGRRMVSFTGDMELLYKANFYCRTALRILKPIYHFKANDADIVYEEAKKVSPVMEDVLPAFANISLPQSKAKLLAKKSNLKPKVSEQDFTLMTVQ